MNLKRKLLLMLFATAVIPAAILAVSIGTGMYQFESIITAMVFQISGLACGYFYGSRIVLQAQSINQALGKIKNGDFEARARIITRDELGEAAGTINDVCDSTLNLIQSSDEQDLIQTAIEGLISEMKEIAAGDLTIRSVVNDDITGSIAASVNDMSQQLRTIVQRVKFAAERVTSLSSSLGDSSMLMSDVSSKQADRIGQASQRLLEMSDSFQNVADLTEQSVQVAVEARQTATNGLKAVSDTVDGMQRIRKQVQNTSKRIKRFGESSQEIGEIVQLISDIADRTSILALNASIQASMAGDAGHGFAVVAEEIEQLAERSTDATNQISKLIRGIQNETSEVISDMEESTRELVAGSQLAAQAGETLFEIDSVSNQLVELIQSSSASALQQAEIAKKVANRMTEISQSTLESAQKSREATQSVGLLADMVNQLRGSVSQFKVSDQGESPNWLNPATEQPAGVTHSEHSATMAQSAGSNPSDATPVSGPPVHAVAAQSTSDMQLQTQLVQAQRTPTHTMCFNESESNDSFVESGDAAGDEFSEKLHAARESIRSKPAVAPAPTETPAARPSRKKVAETLAIGKQKDPQVDNQGQQVTRTQPVLQTPQSASASKPPAGTVQHTMCNDAESRSGDEIDATDLQGGSIDQELMQQIRDASQLVQKIKSPAPESEAEEGGQQKVSEPGVPKTIMLDK